MSNPFSNDIFLDRKTPGGSEFTLSPGVKALDTVQLGEMERSFRSWAKDSPRKDIRRSRQRILHIFLLIRYSGAKLHEILSLKSGDIKLADRVINIRGDGPGSSRSVEIPDDLVKDISNYLQEGSFKADESLFGIDPAHVRRKFYERAEACGLPRSFGNPSTLRRSRSVELMRGNLPLPAIQKLLGHSTPGLTATLLDFSEEDMHHMVRRHIDLESKRRTSARNTFFGKIISVIKGDIQSEVVLLTLGGIHITSIITNNSLERMRLGKGSFVSAEIKAPSVFIAGPEGDLHVSLENRVKGTVTQVITGKVNAEVLLRLEDETDLCAVITSSSLKRLGLRVNDEACALFGSYAVILNIPVC